MMSHSSTPGSHSSLASGRDSAMFLLPMHVCGLGYGFLLPKVSLVVANATVDNCKSSSSEIVFLPLPTSPSSSLRA